MALGVTMQLPEEDKHNYSREYLDDQLAILLGGRIAEEITNGSLTTGAGNDLERVSGLAHKMVCEWGMSEAMGPLTFGKREEQIFLGREIAKTQDYSEDTAVRIDQEIKRIVMNNYERARTLLTSHKELLQKIADELLAREVLDADQVKRLVQGLPLDERPAAPAAPAASSPDVPRRESPERPGIVPPLGKPVTQE
jgi:cell division protease FtsH